MPYQQNVTILQFTVILLTVFFLKDMSEKQYNSARHSNMLAPFTKRNLTTELLSKI